MAREEDDRIERWELEEQIERAGQITIGLICSSKKATNLTLAEHQCRMGADCLGKIA